MATFNRIVCLATVAAGVSFSASAKTCTWINTETSAAQSWSEPANWQGGQVPAAGDDVVISDSTYINLGGAEIGTLTHTKGNLKICTGSLVWTNRGDIVTTGSSVTLLARSTTVAFPEGEHTISNSCKVEMQWADADGGNGVKFIGAGSLVKRGAGKLGLDNGWGYFYYQLTGTLAIYAGEFVTDARGASGGVVWSTDITVSGPTAKFTLQRFANNNFAPGTTLRLDNRGTFNCATTAGKPSLELEHLYINGTECAAGTWKNWNSSLAADYRWMDITTPTDKPLVVKSCSLAMGAFTGLAEGAMASGITRYYIADNGYFSPSSWQDGMLALDLDDVVFNVACQITPPQGKSIPAIHDATCAADVTFWEAPVQFTGDIHLNGGNLSMNWCRNNMSLSAGQHVVDGTGNWTIGNEGNIGGAGSLVWRSSGSFKNGNSANRWNCKGGDLRVENGTFAIQYADYMPNVTNIVVTGENTKLDLSAALNTNVFLTVEKSAVLKTATAGTNVVRRLMMDEHEGRAGRTYGSSTSKARSRNDVNFSGSGVFRPWEDSSGKDPLEDDVGLVIAPIEKQYTDLVTPCEPALTVTDTTTGEEVDSGYYEVAFTNNVLPGTATVRVLGTEGIYEDANAVQTFVVEKDPHLRETRTWTNTNASVAQVWTDPANWKDGKVPSSGDNVIIEGAAWIDFSGAELGSIQHSSGELILDTPTAAMTLNGDLVFSGTKVTMKPTTKITFPDGVHVISNSCAIAFPFCGDPRTDGVTFNGAGSIVKKGKGSMGVESWAYWYVNTTGSFKILGGTVTTSYRSNCPLKCSEFLVSGVNSQLTAAYLNGNGFAAGAVLRLEDGGLVHFSDSDAGNVRLGAVYLDGQQLVAGTWKSWNGSATADYRWVDFLGASNLKITIATGPAEGGFTGLVEGAMWSGRTRYYIVNNGYSSTSSWKDGIPARPLDDVIVQVATTWSNQKHDLNPIHDLTCEKSLTLSEATFTLAGDIHLQNGSGLSLSWEPKAFTLTAGEHVIDGTGDLTLSSWKYMNGAGSLIWRSTGTIKNNDPASNKISITGNLAVEAGTITIPNADYLPNVTNVAVSGEGTLLKLDAAALNADAWVTVEKGAKLRLNGTFENNIKHLVLDGNDRSPRTYGGVSSPAVRKLSKYFTSNAGDKGVLNVTEGHEPGMMLLVR